MAIAAPGFLCADFLLSAKSFPHEMGKVAANAMSRRKGNDSKLPSAASCSPSASLTLMCQDIRVNAQVGTRSPYSLPFVILPVPARSPFRFIRHRRRSTPNLTQNSKNVHLFAPRDLWLWGENCCIMLASARRYASALKKGYTHEKIA